MRRFHGDHIDDVGDDDDAGDGDDAFLSTTTAITEACYGLPRTRRRHRPTTHSVTELHLLKRSDDVHVHVHVRVLDFDLDLDLDQFHLHEC